MTQPPGAPAPAGREGERPRRVALWLKAFWPAPLAIDRRERLRIVAGVAVGILATAVLCRLAGVAAPLPWIVPPIAASALLVFGLPASPLAQPWPVVGGNTVSALVGIACARWVAPPDVAVALAAALAIGSMIALRCLHPPGAAAAMMMVVGGVTAPRAAFFPVMLNSLLLIAFGIAYNNATRRRYPHGQAAAAESGSTARRTTDADLDAVLARYNQLLDVSRDDLQALVEETQLVATERRLAEKRCADIMSPNVWSVEFGTPLQEAWTLLRTHRIKALPVVDRARRVIGVVTLTDFLRAAGVEAHEGVGRRLRGFIRATPQTHSRKAEVVGQIMTRKALVFDSDQRLIDLLPLFVSTGHHHVPVIDAERRLVGIITQSDVVAALAADEPVRK